MKKHLLAFAATAAFFAPGAQAQDTDSDEPTALAVKQLPATRKGNITIGSNIGLANFSYGKSSGASQNFYQYDAQLVPYIGYFVSDHVLLSGYVAVGAAGNGLRDISNYRSVNAGIGISARYYFGRATNAQNEIKKLRFYAEAGGGYFYNWARYSAGGGQKERDDFSDVSLHGGAGLNYFINPNIALEGGLQYYRNLDIERASRYQSNVQLQLGVRIFLNRK